MDGNCKQKNNEQFHNERDIGKIIRKTFGCNYTVKKRALFKKEKKKKTLLIMTRQISPQQYRVK